MGAEGKATVMTATEFELAELLERAGARLVSDRRADCPKCGGRRTVSYLQEVFCCHRAGCDFKGSALTLARELGLAKHLSAEERRALACVRAQAQQAAAWLAAKLRTRRFELYDSHQGLLSILFGTSARLRRDMSDEIAWAGLAYAYPRLDPVRAELAVLESAPIPDRLILLKRSDSHQKEIIRRAIERGGVEDANGHFVEIEVFCPGVFQV
jgi:hypothetical protein